MAQNIPCLAGAQEGRDRAGVVADNVKENLFPHCIELPELLMVRDVASKSPVAVKQA